MKTFGLSFRQIQENLFVDRGSNGFAYSDGQIAEERILEMVSSAQDISSTSWELHEKARTWVERYHLSIHRGSIIRCLPFSSNLQVLELGAGSGAVTRALGERFALVDAVEGSLDRAGICASRCRDLPHVRVFSVDINRVNPEPTYDLVVLIGVLEWSRGFVRGENPFQQCLQIAAKALKEDGKMLLAIENQLGLKYFLGCGEDHCGIPMESLHGYPAFDKARTFSKVALCRKLQSAGFTTFRVMYPFPDYKLARVILTDEAVSLCNESIAFWASRYPFEDYLVPERYKNGNAALVTCEVNKAGLLGELSNSFLVIASRRESASLQSPWLVWSERLTKNKALCSTTTLEKTNNRLQVKKQYPSTSGTVATPSGLRFKLNAPPPQPFLDGSSVEMELLRYAISGRGNDFLQTLNEWMAYVEKHFGRSTESTLAPNAWDCIPRNLIRLKNRTLEAFDLEFENRNSFGLEELCTRGLLFWFLDHAPWATGLNPKAKTVRDHILWVLSTLFPSHDSSATIDSVIRQETNFQMWVNPLEEEVDISGAVDTPINVRDTTSLIAHLKDELQTTQQELNHLQEHSNRLQAFADAVRGTLVYRFYRRVIRPFVSG
ncbi:MAG: class I SAM-dependent methyltransferase [Deltaproteobacteria bacterium]|nr:class I SAM-dependent methyltransferase [Deltaproteobacteria bacterium]